MREKVKKVFEAKTQHSEATDPSKEYKEQITQM
ncbi:hypothetical protein, partial [Bacillus subtilis]